MWQYIPERRLGSLRSLCIKLLPRLAQLALDAGHNGRAVRLAHARVERRLEHRRVEPRRVADAHLAGRREGRVCARYGRRPDPTC